MEIPKQELCLHGDGNTSLASHPSASPFEVLIPVLNLPLCAPNALLLWHCQRWVWWQLAVGSARVVSNLLHWMCLGGSEEKFSRSLTLPTRISRSSGKRPKFLRETVTLAFSTGFHDSIHPRQARVVRCADGLADCPYVLYGRFGSLKWTPTVDCHLRYATSGISIVLFNIPYFVAMFLI